MLKFGLFIDRYVIFAIARKRVLDPSHSFAHNILYLFVVILNRTKMDYKSFATPFHSGVRWPSSCNLPHNLTPK